MPNSNFESQASMRQLARNNQKAIESYTPLDYEHLQSITYLYEFDRAVQLVLVSV